MELYYVSSPYSATSKDQGQTPGVVRETRYKHVAKWLAMASMDLKYSDVIFFSPIAQWHPIALNHGLPKEFKYWAKRDFGMIEKCDRVLVLCFPGWENSEGMMWEIILAEALGKPISYIEDPSKV